MCSVCLLCTLFLRLELDTVFFLAVFSIMTLNEAGVINFDNGHFFPIFRQIVAVSLTAVIYH